MDNTVIQVLTESIIQVVTDKKAIEPEKQIDIVTQAITESITQLLTDKEVNTHDVIQVTNKSNTNIELEESIEKEKQFLRIVREKLVCEQKLLDTIKGKLECEQKLLDTKKEKLVCELKLLDTIKERLKKEEDIYNIKNNLSQSPSPTMYNVHNVINQVHENMSKTTNDQISSNKINITKMNPFVLQKYKR